MEEAAEEIAGRKAEPALEEGGWHYNFIGVRGGDVFILLRLSLENGVVGEKMVLYEIEELTLVNGGRFEHFWVRGGHGENV
jgi:hypothetical protein